MVYPIKLKLGMLDHKSNTFLNTVFYISVDVLNQPKIKIIQKVSNSNNLFVFACDTKSFLIAFPFLLSLLSVFERTKKYFFLFFNIYFNPLPIGAFGQY